MKSEIKFADEKVQKNFKELKDTKNQPHSSFLNFPT
jgi:hypothetical protein